MSIKADLLGQVVLRQGAESDQSRLFTISDRTVTGFVTHRFSLASTAPYEIPLAGAAGTGTRALYLEADKGLQLGFVSTQTRNNIPANGFYLAMLTGTTHIWVKTLTTTLTTIQAMVIKF